MTYLKSHEEYEDRYDHITVEYGRSEVKWFIQAREEFYKKYKGKDLPKNLEFWWDRICFWLIDLPLGERWEKKNETIECWQEEDKAKDARLERARLLIEPVCCRCSKTGLRITSKHFMNRNKDYDNSKDEQVLIILRRTHCKLATTYWEDGEQYEVEPTLCPRCDSNMTEKITNRGRVITSLYTCPACGHRYSSKLDLRREKEEIDKDYEQDKAIYCVSDKRGQGLTLYRTTKWLLLKQAYDEFHEKEANKDLFDAIERIKKMLKEDYGLWIIDAICHTGRAAQAVKQYLIDSLAFDTIDTAQDVIHFGALHVTSFTQSPDAPWRLIKSLTPECVGSVIEMSLKPHVEYPWEYSSFENFYKQAKQIGGIIL